MWDWSTTSVVREQRDEHWCLAHFLPFDLKGPSPRNVPLALGMGLQTLTEAPTGVATVMLNPFKLLMKTDPHGTTRLCPLQFYTDAKTPHIAMSSLSHQTYGIFRSLHMNPHHLSPEASSHLHSSLASVLLSTGSLVLCGPD